MPKGEGGRSHPPGVSDNTSVNYSNAEMGMAGFLAFSFGEVDVAIGAGNEIEFNGASINTDNETDEALEESLTTGSLLLAGLTAGVTNTFSINPATALIGLETLAFVDVGLFEEELTLYGQIGNGIGLALAQCEEQEGCAPNVTEEELNNIISSLDKPNLFKR